MELFAHRNFTCDCGTTRLPRETPCTLRIDPVRGTKRPVHSEEASHGNTYNKNFRNIFCGCGEVYDAHKQKGTMYQCIGIATEEDGGCGEDWWHPECLLGWRKDWYLQGDKPMSVNVDSTDEDSKDEHPTPPGFPEELEAMMCYKCVGVSPWIKKYASSEGFMNIPYNPEPADIKAEHSTSESEMKTSIVEGTSSVKVENSTLESARKHKVDDEEPNSRSVVSKRTKLDAVGEPASKPIHATLPPGPTGALSLIALDEDFRSRFCRCPTCYPVISKYPQLLEEEDTYEPPVSEDGDAEGPGSIGTGSLLDRGEAALSNVDRVRAIGKCVSV